MPKVTPDKIRIKALIRHLEDGKFAVPRLQRNFVWDKKKACDLVDSINRKLPVGTLIIWEAKSDKRHELKHAKTIIPDHDPQNPHIWFVIDGQQRLSVIYNVFKGNEVKNDKQQNITFDHLCISFDGDNGPEFAYKNKHDHKIHIALFRLLSGNWSKALRGLNKTKREYCKRFRRIFLDYELPVIWVSDCSRDDVKDAFIRINSAGLRISSADRLFAYASNIDLRNMTEELQGSLGEFSKIDIGIIQMAMAFIFGETEPSSRSIEALIKRLDRQEVVDGAISKEFTKKWKKVERAVKNSIDYLKAELGVRNLSLLPSNNMISILSYFFFENNLAQPTPLQRREIRKWFWATAVAHRYTGRGYHQNIKSDIAYFKRLGRNRNGRFSFSDLVDRGDVRRTEYHNRGGLISAFYILLLKRRPRYILSGNEIPVDEAISISNRKDKHHIFPKDLLRSNDFSAKEANSLCNICFIAAKENIPFSNKKPVVYLDEHRRSKHFASTMKSHLIPYKSVSPLWDDNARRGFRKFVDERLELICSEFEKEAGMRLFKR